MSVVLRDGRRGVIVGPPFKAKGGQYWPVLLTGYVNPISVKAAEMKNEEGA